MQTIALVAATLCHSGASSAQQSATSIESKFISNVRQLTFEGLRAGEGYYNSDGSLMVFQSERRPDNPFFQIYLLDLQTGDVEPISPGHGKTTCSWIHPDHNRVMFSSTHGDPEVRAKQKAELEFRESGQTRRYAWDYDDTFEIYAFDRAQKTYTQLTNTMGYDAEGCYSPDGTQIVFASNRAGFDPNEALTEEQRDRFEIDPSFLMDIYIMNADGSNVRRLTKSLGYDGGPFFSQDGLKICWRRFSEDGKTAEIFTMNLDGSNQLQLTRMGALSWAPFFHPSGKYLIFNTNLHGFANFELYLVAADGKSLPVRVSDTDGFDGLASFTPDGNQLTWTSGRTAKKDSQIFVANWNHEAALQALIHSGIQPAKPTSSDPSKSVAASPSTAAPAGEKSPRGATPPALDQVAFQAGQAAARQTKPGFDSGDVQLHIDYLTQAGAPTSGSAGQHKIASYVAGYLATLGLKPEAGGDQWLQAFEYPSKVEFSETSQLAEKFSGEDETVLDLGFDWSPLAVSGNVDANNRPVVFAGYGIVAPAHNEQAAYDSYADLKVDVKDKWVLVFKSAPKSADPQQQAVLNFYGSLNCKLQFAKERGALGLILIDDDRAKAGEGGLPGGATAYAPNLAAIAVNEQVAEGWLSSSADSINELKAQLDQGEQVDPFEIADVKLAIKLDSESTNAQGQNFLARLSCGDQPTSAAVLICASLDAGTVVGGNAENQAPHTPGADGVSGIAGLLEIAEFLASQQQAGKLALKQDLIFALWSGQEQGLHGSAQSAQSLSRLTAPDSEKQFVIQLDTNGAIIVKDQPATLESLSPTFTYLSKNHPDYVVVVQCPGEIKSEHAEPIRIAAEQHGISNIRFVGSDVLASVRPLTAVVHLDRIGRLNEKLMLLGTGSSTYWSPVIESKNVVAGLPLATFDELLFPSDAGSFQAAGVPVISAFTGVHPDLGSSTDTADKANAQGIASISQLMGLITRGLAITEGQPEFVAPEPKIKRVARSSGGASLGTIPDYSADVVGVKVSDVRPGTPAQKAGLKPNDVIIELAGREIDSVQTYADILNEIQIGEETEVVIERDGQQLKFKITPIARQR